MYTPNEEMKTKRYFHWSQMLILQNPVFFFNAELKIPYQISYQQFSIFLSFMKTLFEK